MAGVRPTLWLLAGTVALVLLIACVNVASLQIVRGSAQAEGTGGARRARRRPRAAGVADARGEPVAERGRGRRGSAAGHLDGRMGRVSAAGHQPSGARRPRIQRRRCGVRRHADPRRRRCRRPRAGTAALACERAGHAAGRLTRRDRRRARPPAPARAARPRARARPRAAGRRRADGPHAAAAAGRRSRVRPSQPADVHPVASAALPHDSARVCSTSIARPRPLRHCRASNAVSAINHLPLAGDTWHFRIQPEGRPEPRPGEEPTATWRRRSPRLLRARCACRCGAGATSTGAIARTACRCASSTRRWPAALARAGSDRRGGSAWVRTRAALADGRRRQRQRAADRSGPAACRKRSTSRTRSTRPSSDRAS